MTVKHSFKATGTGNKCNICN